MARGRPGDTESDQRLTANPERGKSIESCRGT